MIQTFQQYHQLNESKQVGVIYHYTNLLGLNGIIESNSLKCSNPNKNAEEPTFYISFTRDKIFNKYLRSNGVNRVRITIDGDKLSNKYKINPFNYYQKTYFKEIEDYESEERIKSKDHTWFEIKDFDKYVISYEILEDEYFTERDKQYTEKLLKANPKVKLVDKKYNKLAA